MKKTSENILFEGNWLRLKHLQYINKQGISINWESIERKNTKKILVILAKLIPSQRYLLIRQFRPAINNTVLGLPAGIASCDDIEKEALKELKEETGYQGKITSKSPALAFNPALTNETVQIISIDIDEKALENLNTQQSLEPAEQIEVVLVDKDKIKDFLHVEHKKGHGISIALWYLFGDLI